MHSWFKFDSTGVRQWGTYFGDLGEDKALSLAIDASGNFYLTGSTTSTSGIATAGAFQVINGGGIGDAFLAKLNSSGSVLHGLLILATRGKKMASLLRWIFPVMYM